MTTRMACAFALASGGVAFASPALAYIGPGSGISLLGGLWGVLVTIVLAVSAVLIWPVRYMIRRIKRKRREAAQVQPAESTNPTHPTDPANPDQSAPPAESASAEPSSSRLE